jgi:hypothetical protein
VLEQNVFSHRIRYDYGDNGRRIEAATVDRDKSVGATGGHYIRGDGFD